MNRCLLDAGICEYALDCISCIYALLCSLSIDAQRKCNMHIDVLFNRNAFEASKDYLHLAENQVTALCKAIMSQADMIWRSAIGGNLFYAYIIPEVKCIYTAKCSSNAPKYKVAKVLDGFDGIALTDGKLAAFASKDSSKMAFFMFI